MDTAARPPAWPLALLFWMTPLWGLFAALDPLRPPLPLPLPLPAVRWLGAAALVLLGIVAWNALRRSAPAGWRMGFCAGGVASIASGLLGFDPATGIAFGIGVLGIGLGGLAVALGDEATTRMCLQAFVCSSLAAAAASLVMVATHLPFGLYEYNNGRAVGTFLNPNELAGYAIVALGATLPAALVARDRLAIFATVSLAGALAATFSRWGFVSAAAALTMFAALSRSRFAIAAVLAVALVGTALDVTLGGRHHNPVDRDLQGTAWSAGLATFEHFPLFGVGPLAYARTYDEMRPPQGPGADHPIAFDPHSLPIAIAASEGIVGLLTLLGTVAWLLRLGYREAMRAPAGGRLSAFALLCAVAGIVVDSIPNTIAVFIPLLYLSVGLAIATARNARA